MIHFIFSSLRTRLKQTIALLILFLFLSLSAFSQEDNGVFTSDDSFQPEKTGRLLLSVSNLNFFKNNEYKSTYADGYTLAGSWVRPKLLFYPDHKLRLELGGQILKYTGRDEFTVYPWFSVVYKPIKELSFRMGNLNQDNNHGLPEPVMDREHYFKEKPEAGIQVKYDHPGFTADLWINWEKMIFKGDPYKERFVFGTVAGLTLLKTEERKLSLPVVFNGLHEGGEIDDAPGQAQTHIVVSEGIRYEYKTGGSLVKAGRLEFSFLQSTYPLLETALPGKSGTAIFIQTEMITDYGRFGSGYWQGNRFFTPLGMPLFQNGAIGQSTAKDKNRLVVLSYRFDHNLFESSKFGFTSDMLYNPDTRKLSNYASLYLMINFSCLFRKNGL